LPVKRLPLNFTGNCDLNARMLLIHILWHPKSKLYMQIHDDLLRQYLKDEMMSISQFFNGNRTETSLKKQQTENIKNIHFNFFSQVLKHKKSPTSSQSLKAQKSSPLYNPLYLNLLKNETTSITSRAYLINTTTHERFPLYYDQVNIGRSEANHILIHHDSISKKHAVISKKPSGYFLKDQQSKNGTFLNHVKIEGEVNLDNGALITFGDKEFIFIC